MSSRFPRSSGFVLTALLIVSLAGCGGGDGRVSVSGTVTFMGQNVDGGAITFVPDGGSGTKSGGEIVNGKYSISAERGPAPGHYTVQIIWNKKTGKQIPTPGDKEVTTDEVKQVIPPIFNQGSTLKKEIKSGENKIDFDLKTN